MSEWEGLAAWWLGEVVDDPAYRDDVMPLTRDVFAAPDGIVLDVGCGEGRVMRALGRRTVIGCDVTVPLLTAAASAGSVVRGRLPSLAWLRPESVSGIVSILVIEHIGDLGALFAEASRVTVKHGTMTVVMNHPAYTAPTSGPIVDESDGEVLWRWGPYFDSATSHHPAGETMVTFHHRSIATLLNRAADAGWSLERVEERALSAATIARYPSLAGQEHFPRLLGVRWRNP